MKAIIIDDEPDCVKLLALQLKMYCPQVEVIGEYTGSEEGLNAIRGTAPDVVFLDIEMPKMNGFQLLEMVGDLSFAVVFVTAYDKFAVKAFKFSAIDYLLKPTDAKDLIAAVQKVERSRRMDSRQLALLKQHLSPAKPFPEKIALPHHDGIIFVELKNVLYCEADNNYTWFFLANGQKHLVSKTLRDIQDTLEERNFLRVSRQHLINLDHIAKFMKGEGSYVIMTDGQSITVARSQKEKLVERFGWL
ncbi:LytR/AlgR family response regulator transcription factor [Runella slithyformis]|uniref:Two component transcriptional regulator, LytTR family n=1 Tax=Runella slithyformis (strain ATCC 29530 / DSM 19594 / LMG 11500 / NCIMB 11436 / LSU 4) TaxID=761193 RepID=A0A7U3ZNE0_RUNSL|nr:LytTR family DNA-binding domain-containing protein [Runella slithyformis]AEI50420.1 two component transcriptional regulator, LytTR family [Runella slithyformis DSM 19594]